MSEQGQQIMAALTEASEALAESTSWGTTRQDMALSAVLTGAQGAVQMFDQLTAQVVALEARVAALENPPAPPAPAPEPTP